MTPARACCDRQATPQKQTISDPDDHEREASTAMSPPPRPSLRPALAQTIGPRRRAARVERLRRKPELKSSTAVWLRAKQRGQCLTNSQAALGVIVSPQRGQFRNNIGRARSDHRRTCNTFDVALGLLVCRSASLSVGLVDGAVMFTSPLFRPQTESTAQAERLPMGCRPHLVPRPTAPSPPSPAAAPHGGGDGGVVALVLVGIGLGEVGERPVEGVGRSEIG